MALVLQLLPLLLWRVQGDPGGKLSLGNQRERVSLDGRPGDRVNLSCVGVSHPVRWIWAPSFPTCKGLPKGRRRILWVSSSGTPTVSPVQPFAGRLRALDHRGIRRLELLLRAGDSGTFICRGRHEDESHTVLRVLGDAADCRGSGPSLGSVYPLLLIPLLGAGLVLGLGAVSAVWWQRRVVMKNQGGNTGGSQRRWLFHNPDRRSPPRPPRPLPRTVPQVKTEPQRQAKAEEPKTAGDLDQESSLLYADLDHAALRRSCRLSPVVPADSSTIYAVVV